jgi:ribose transport system substrate-binding protein
MTGCERKPVSKDGKKTIGFSVFDMQPNFFQDMERGTRGACKEKGFNYKLYDQKSDAARMVSGCENLLTQGIDALIISPCEPSALGPVVSKSKKMGIPVIINDIGGGNSDYDVIVISDSYGGGALAAEYMAEKLNMRKTASKNIGIIKCAPGHIYAIRRGEGFEKQIKKMGFKIVSTLCASSMKDQAYRVMQDMMTANPSIAGVFCENDPMALGAVQAIRDAGKSPINDILVVGFNADYEAIEAVKAGNLAATVQQVPYEMGQKCVELAERLLAGEKLKFTNQELREITVPVRMITKENVKQFFPDTKKN